MFLQAGEIVITVRYGKSYKYITTKKFAQVALLQKTVKTEGIACFHLQILLKAEKQSKKQVTSTYCQCKLCARILATRLP